MDLKSHTSDDGIQKPYSFHSAAGSFHLVKFSCIWTSVNFLMGMHGLTIIFLYKTEI